ncbi:hypothetical protein FIU87_10950 [Bacillus sp. THAF10]|uniref:hypothetical protein n=1 Tax=Bacillus sp. THAF10 TaxID=2587848 RepID=UPI001268B661|nr:hypothetical protein [Bacillus sp. THAF10]QFT89165.1 hypothetical protein FIU87_10950 [Bacillus sp. THAF10]
MEFHNYNIPAEPRIFMNTHAISSNQQEYRKNYLSAILEEQSEINKTVSSSVDEMKENFNENFDTQEKHFVQLLEIIQLQETKSDEIKENILSNEAIVEQKIESLHVLINEQISLELQSRLDKLETIFAEEKLLSQATIDQLACQENLTRSISSRLENYEELYKDIRAKISDQELLFKRINEKLEIQEMFHQSVMERLAHQDEVAQNMTKQLEILKKNLMEKVESAITSIDTKYKQTLHYFSGIFGLQERVIQKQPTSNEKINEEKVEVEQK